MFPTTLQLSHEAPLDQPTSVAQVTERLFRTYRVEGGAVRLAGCRLDDQLFARIEYDLGGRRVELVMDAAGTPLAPERIAQLGIDRTGPLGTKPTQPFEAAIRRLVEQGRTRLAAEASAPPEPLKVAAVWCKYVAGKLRFIIGSSAVDLPFEGWGRTLAAPPLICPHTGVKTFHVAATDDGRVVAADQIEVCAASGRRVLGAELVTCSATAKRVLPEWVEPCAVSGLPVLASALVVCRTCGQRVSPTCVEREQCETCRALVPVGADDPRLGRLLGEYPALARWSSWRLGTSANVWVLTAGRWFKRLLLVVDRESHAVKHAALATRLVGSWKTLEPDQRRLLLGEK